MNNRLDDIHVKISKSKLKELKNILNTTDIIIIINKAIDLLLIALIYSDDEKMVTIKNDRYTTKVALKTL
jgi:hypothetical protein